MGRESAAVKKAAAPAPPSAKASPAKAAAASDAVSTAARGSGARGGGKAATSSGGGASGVAFLLAWAIRLPLIAFILYEAYVIRLYAIKNYGLVIHEFDPWFNFRATQCVARLCVLFFPVRESSSAWWCQRSQSCINADRSGACSMPNAFPWIRSPAAMLRALKYCEWRLILLRSLAAL